MMSDDFMGRKIDTLAFVEVGMVMEVNSYIPRSEQQEAMNSCISPDQLYPPQNHPTPNSIPFLASAPHATLTAPLTTFTPYYLYSTPL
jgi:hypothetical protein